MKILRDSRQIPKKKEYTANKMYSDTVYSWLQVNSQWDKETNVRWIAKKDVKFIDIASDLRISRQTASTKFKRLLDKDEKGNLGLGLVIFNKDKKRYELQLLSADMAMLIEKGTLRKMLSALNENAISVYIYILNRYIANQEQSFEFTIEQIKVFIGIGICGRSNDYIITDILSVLKKLGLIHYRLINRSDGKDIKSVYIMEQVRNEIIDEC